MLQELSGITSSYVDVYRCMSMTYVRCLYEVQSGGQHLQLPDAHARDSPFMT